MLLPSILAQIHRPEPSVETVVGFVLLTILFLLLCGVVLLWGRTLASRLLVLGLLVAVVSVGYGTMIILPTMTVLASGLMKIAIILVLAGVACSVLPLFRGESPLETTASEKPHHEV